MILTKSYRNYGLVYAIALMMVEFLYPALPSIAHDFSIASQQAQWLVTVFLGAAMMAEFVMPIILIQCSSNIMHHMVMVIGIVSCIGSIWAKHFIFLIMFRFLMGLSAGGLIILMRIQIESAEKNKYKGFHYAVGAILGFHAVMSILAPTTAAFLINHYGWHAIQWFFTGGLIMISHIVHTWSRGLDLSDWNWCSYRKSICFLFKHPDKIKQIALAGFIGSVPMCEVIFSAFYLTNHFGFTILQLGLYFSLIKLMDACIRFSLPYVLNEKVHLRMLNLGIGLFVFGVFSLLQAFFYDQIAFYCLGCMLINVTSNGFLVIFAIDVFCDVSRDAPITGNALFGSLQFGSCFIASAILGLFFKLQLLGFIIFLCLNFVFFIALLMPKHQTLFRFA